MFKPHKVIDLYKKVIDTPSATLFPTDTDFDFWDDVYEDFQAEIDREFARRFKNFLYFDFLEAEATSDALTNFQSDVLSVLTFNQKRYSEMYRVFVVTDEDDPLTYNYDMVETTGAQHTQTEYGATSQTKGQETFTKGEEQITKGSQSNTIGGTTNTHAVAPYNDQTLTAESSDTMTQRSDTEGQRIDTEGQRQDTTSARTDTALAHTDKVDSDEWTLTRRGNIGVQTASDMLRLHTQYWTEQYKFMQLIFDDIAAQLLLNGDD